MGYPSPEVVKRPTKGSYPEGSYEACQANQDPNINYFADPCRDLPMNNGLPKSPLEGSGDGDGQDFLEMILKGILREPATISSDPTVRTSRPSQLSTPGSSVSAVKSDSGDMLLSAIKAFATPKSLI